MGTSTDGILIYGYDLGGPEGIKLVEARPGDDNEYGELRVPWMTETNNDDEDEFQAMLRVLHDAIPGAEPVEYDWEREDPVKDHYGIELYTHCSSDYPMYVLGTHEIRAWRGSPQPVDFAALARLAAEEDWDGKLAAALRVLGVTPTQDRPGWILASNWG